MTATKCKTRILPLNILTLVAILAAFSPPFFHTSAYAQTQATLAASTLSVGSRPDVSSLSWSAVTGAASYEISRKVTGGNWSQISSTTATSYTDSAVTLWTTYHYRVRAVKTGGDPGPWSNEVAHTVALPPPSPRRLPTPTVVSHDSIQVSWTSSWSSAWRVTGYDLRWRRDGTSSWTYAYSVSSGRSISSLQPSTRYEVQMRGKNIGGVSAWSPSGYATTWTRPQSRPSTPSPPSRPSTPSVTALGHDSIQISWSSVSRATAYDLRWRRDGTSSWTYAYSVSTGHSIPNLQPETRYEAQVRAKNSGGGSAWSASDSATTQPPPDISASVTTTPQDVAVGSSIDLQATATDPLNESLTYSWTADPDVGSFDNANLLTPTWTAPTPSANQPVTLTLTVTGTYNRIKSDTVILTAVPVPGVPTALSVIAVDHDSLRVIWSAPTSGGTPIYYDLEYGVADGVPDRFFGTSWKDSHSLRTLNGLTPNTKYKFRVQAENSAGESAWSTIVTARTLPPPSPIDASVTTPPQDVAAGASIDLQATANDPLNEDLKYSWTADPAGGSFDDSKVLTPTWTAPTPSANQPVTLTLTVTGTYSRSTQATVILTAVPLPDVPVAPKVTSVDHDSLQVTWSAPTGGGTPTAYDLQYKVANSPDWKTVENVTSSQALDGLMPHLRYEVQVRARNIAGASAWSGSGYADTPPPPDISASVTTTPQDVAAGASIDLQATANDPLNEDLKYSWTADPDVGSFDDSKILTPTWTAPTPSANQSVTLTLTVSGTYNRIKSGTVILTVVPAPGVPAAPTVSAIDHDSLQVTWSAPTSGGTPTSYDLQYKVAANSDWITVAGVTSPHALDGLMPHLRYEVQVRARNIAGTSAWSGSGHADTLPPPDISVSVTTTPQDVAAGSSIQLAATADDPIGGGLKYSWAADPAVGSFDNSKILAPKWTAPTPSANQHVTLTLTVTGTYNRTKTGTVILTVVPAPGVPAAPTVSAVDHDSLQVIWSAPASGGTPTGYDLRYKVAANTDWITVENATSPHTLNGLTSNTTYHVQVRAKNLAGTSGWSDRKKGTTQTVLAPGVPTSVSVSAIDHDSLQVTWSAPASGGTPTSYDLRYKVAANSDWITVAGVTSPYTLNDLTSNTTYHVQVLARNSAGTTKSDRKKGTTQTVLAPGVPTSVSVSAIDHDSLQVTWSAPTSGGTPTSYDLRYKVADNTNWTTVENVTSPQALNDLTQNTKYHVQVRAKNSAGTSEWSDRKKGST